MSLAALPEEERSSRFEWQKARLRPNASLGLPAGGFGPDGHYELWLPSPVAQTKFVFVKKKPQLQQVESCMTRPAIVELRDRAFEDATTDGTRILAGQSFVAYVAAVLEINYELSDGDLNMLLSGDKWHEPMLSHLLGGDGAIQRLLYHRRPSISPPAAPVSAAPASPLLAAPQSAGFLSRLRAKLWR